MNVVLEIATHSKVKSFPLFPSTRKSDKLSTTSIPLIYSVSSDSSFVLGDTTDGGILLTVMIHSALVTTMPLFIHRKQIRGIVLFTNIRSSDALDILNKSPQFST